MNSDITSFFVYGTLRPDDDSGATWKKDFLDGSTCRKAVLRDAKLFFDEYPCAVLNCRGSSVIGYVVTFPAQDFPAKLREGDRIEACPSEYQRNAVEVELMDGACRAYVYHRESCKGDQAIESGNWLNRGKIQLKPNLYAEETPCL